MPSHEKLLDLLSASQKEGSKLPITSDKVNDKIHANFNTKHFLNKAKVLHISIILKY